MLTVRHGLSLKHCMRSRGRNPCELRRLQASSSEKFKVLRGEVKRLVAESRTRFLENIDNDLQNNPKRFWSIFRIRNKSCGERSHVSMGSNEPADLTTLRTASHPRDIAELFNEHFSSILTENNNQIDLGNASTLLIEKFTLSEINQQRDLTGTKQQDLTKNIEGNLSSNCPIVVFTI